jgi:menaquinone-9 beta-reductase
VSHIEVHGAGLAGSAAAIAARLCGAEVDLYDPAPFPRHKVCGEFLSPEVLPVLDALGLREQFQSLQPVCYTDLTLRFGHRSLRAPLPKPAYGLSRFALDHLLVRHATALGARLHRERAPQPGAEGQGSRPIVSALGRHGAVNSVPAASGPRYFGFKAHFLGDPPDPLTLYFHRHTYVGVNRVEGGAINVCGLAPEAELARFQFRIDDFLASLPGFSVLVLPLRRSMRWLTTGPILYRQRFDLSYYRQYFAGDSTSFIDPFTGSGQLSALLTGSLAGFCAARGVSPDDYGRICRGLLQWPFWSATVIRTALQTPIAPLAAQCIPLSWLVRATRPARTAQMLDVLGFLKKGKPADTRRKIPAGRLTHLGEASGPTGDG